MSRVMKDSGIEWCGLIPINWNVMPNKYIMFKKKDICFSYKGENILSLTMDGVIVRDLEAGGKMPVSFDGYQIVHTNNLLMCLFDYDVTPRCIGLIKNEGLTSPAYSQFILKNGNNPRYYYYYYLMIDNKKELLHLTKNLRHSFTEEQFGMINAPVPPIEEQVKIADFLDKKVYEIDSVIEKTKVTIEDYKKYKQSIITETVTKGLNPEVEMKDSGIDWIGNIPNKWQCKKIKYVTTISRGLFSHRPRNDSRYYGGIYPFIQTGDVTKSNKYITTYSQTLNELGKNVSKKFPKGTLTMTIAANVGDVAILNFDAYFPDSIVGFIPKHDCEAIYLYYIFSVMKEQFINSAIISTQLNLNIERVKELSIPYTQNICEQKEIVSYLDKKCFEIDKLIIKKEELIKELENYKKSLIYECVTGKREV